MNPTLKSPSDPFKDIFLPKVDFFLHWRVDSPRLSSYGTCCTPVPGSGRSSPRSTGRPSPPQSPRPAVTSCRSPCCRWSMSGTTSSPGLWWRDLWGWTGVRTQNESSIISGHILPSKNLYELEWIKKWTSPNAVPWLKLTLIYIIFKPDDCSNAVYCRIAVFTCQCVTDSGDTWACQLFVDQTVQLWPHV